MTRDTRTDLPNALRRLASHPERERAIADAQAGMFHEFRSPLYPGAKSALCFALGRLEHITGDQGYRRLALTIAGAATRAEGYYSTR